jgi:ABC-type antimicrobial peptide transport system permease subunit
MIDFKRPKAWHETRAAYLPRSFKIFAMLRNYLKIAWRNIQRNKAYTIINILGLSLGISSCIVIFLVAQYELSFDKFHSDSNRIYRIVGEIEEPNGEKNFLNNLIPDVAGLQNQIPGFETTAAFHSYGGSIAIPNGSNPAKKFDNKIDGSYSSTSIFTWPSYFNIFQYQWLEGNSNSLSEPFKVVLTESRARKYFGNIPLLEVIGKTVVYDDSIRVSVSGIVKDWTQKSDFAFTDFISVSTATHSFLKSNIPTEDWSSLRPHNGSAFVKLTKTATPEQVNRSIANFIKLHVPDAHGKLMMYLQPLASLHFTDQYRRGDDGDDFRKAYMPTLYILMGIALFILAIAAINFINLSTAQSLQRVKEIGVRKVMGSSKRNITLQFLVETLILTALAVVLSILLVDPILFLFKDFLPPGIVFNPFNFQVLACIGCIIIITTLLAGYYPARVLSSFIPVLSLKANMLQNGSKPVNVRKALIIFQFSMTLVFIIGVITMSKQMNFMQNGDKGFNPDAIVTITKWNDDGRLKILAENIKHIAGVDKVLLQVTAPMGFAQMSANYKFKGNDEKVLQPILEIGNEDYILFYQMKLIAGRNMLHSDSLNELLINETLAKEIGFENPEDAIGKMLFADRNGIEEAYPIVGVVADFHQGSFHDAIRPAIIENAPDIRKRSVAIKLTANEKNVKEVKTILAQIEKEWRKLYKGEPLDYSFLNESIGWLYGQEKKSAWLVSAATIITIFTSCLGLIGLSMFTAERKTKEIGIRKVLGASVPDIAIMLGKDFMKLLMISFVIATPVAFYLSNSWLQDFVYRTNVSWWVFLLAGITLVTITLLTISVQAIKAALANPVKSLRSE